MVFVVREYHGCKKRTNDKNGSLLIVKVFTVHKTVSWDRKLKPDALSIAFLNSRTFTVSAIWALVQVWELIISKAGFRRSTKTFQANKFCLERNIRKPSWNIQIASKYDNIVVWFPSRTKNSIPSSSLRQMNFNFPISIIILSKTFQLIVNVHRHRHTKVVEYS